ncbi:MAG TPA: hypothetical protein VMB49_13135 [Acidobacteriaceae bacterium]|nr:hypothetical protein [Acidobacteriaceae bacterium]
MRETFSIWWFAGILMLAYGVIILSTGLWELSHPLPNPPVLSNLHAPIWWGGMLTVLGLIYVIGFRPRNKSSKGRK